MMLKLRHSSLLILTLVLPLLARGAAIFEENTAWKYFKGTSEASTPSSAWRQLGFNDASWLSGNAPFFYEDGSGYSGNTDLGGQNVPGGMRGNYSSIFMRKTFQIANPAGVLDLTLNVRSDDGCIVWINGTRVLLLDMPDAEPSFDDVPLSNGQEPDTFNGPIANPSSILVAGENVIAIEAFNASVGGSSDFLIAASLSTTVDTIPPSADALPPPGSVIRQLAQIEILFDEAVTGVNASDLLINNVAATGLSAPSPVDYIFTFPQPANGPVQVRWAASHGIRDTSPAANPFPGGSWSYTLDPTAPEATVIISEFMANNDHLDIRDEDGSREDWIEILNLGPVAANLSGWFLTDNSGDLSQWRFPAITLNVGEYLVVWASGKNRTDPTKPLHTSFNLSAGGEYLALVDANTNVVSEFAPEYPAQPSDKSYGRAQGAPTVVGFFDTPTPGAANSTTGAGFAPEPVFSLPGGAYPNSSLSLTITTSAGTIRYTTDGSVPTQSSARYTGPINITSSTRIKARVFASGLLPGPVVGHTYHLLASDARNFNSNLPLILINTHGQSIPGSGASSRIKASVVVIDTFRGRTAITDAPQFEGFCEVQERGQSSAGWPKRQYNLEINDFYGNDEEVPLLGLPEESDWVLNGPYSDKTLMNNFLAYELHEKMGHYSVRRRFCELFVAQTSSSGQMNYPGDYRGVYVLLEKIKIDNHRVDIERLTPAHTAEPEITGGYIWKKDKNSPEDAVRQDNFSTPRQGLKHHDPHGNELTAAQRNWLHNYLTEFENNLYSATWTDPVNGYAKYIDVNSFADFHWIVEFAKQIDGYRLSNYMYKDRGGKIKMEPIWDWNLAWGNANYLDGGHFSGWYYPLINEGQHIWLRRLVSSPGAPDFQQAIVDRWSVLRTNILAKSNVLARVDQLYTNLTEAAGRDWQKYQSQRLSYHWPNPNGGSWDVNYATPGSYANLIHGSQGMKHWINGRFDWIDSQFHKVPEFSSPGGVVPPGFALTISAPAGTIYYTIDGRDPRASGGGIAAYALQYSGAIILNDNARVVARARVGSGKWANVPWSGPTAATFVIQTPPLAISEIMYHPAPPALGDTNAVGNFEFIELKNVGAGVLNLAGFQFVKGIQFNFSTGAVTSLSPGDHVVLVKNRTAFTSRYGAVPRIAGQYRGGLRDSGERLTLIGPMLEVVEDISFKDGWYPATDGLGFALAATDTIPSGGDGNLPAADRLAWRTGSVVGGTPGQDEPPPPVIPPILVNEALTHTDLPQVDSIELYNPNSTNVNISGWFLSDDFRQPKYRIPDGTIIPAQGYVVFDEADFNPTPGTNNSFNLRSSGDEAYVFSADPAGHLTGYVHGFDFGAALNGISFGRHITSVGAEHFVAQSANTLGDPNAGPRVGPVVISEIMYRPQDVFVNNAYWDNTEEEFIELHNIASTNVLLYDPNAPTNTWRLRDAVRYTFATNQTLLAGERILIVNFDPALDPAAAAAFRSKYSVSPSIRLFGPYGGKLGNQGEDVELIQPDMVRFYQTNIVITAVLIDKVDYTATTPWSPGADGIGFSLQRIVESQYGNDPANWSAARPTAGRAYTPGSAPVITLQPVSQSAIAGETVTFFVTVTGPGPYQYQWRKDGLILPGAIGPVLSLPDVQTTHQGNYQVIVLNPVNSVVSQIATLTVISPARITAQPESVQVNPGERVVLAIAATSSTAITYQWRKNGVPIPGATNTVLEFPSAEPRHSGDYDVLVTDAVATIASDTARVSVLVDPKLVQLPVDQTNVVGSTIILSVQVTNNATLPITYRWRHNNRTITSDVWPDGYRILYTRTAFLTLTNVQLEQAGTYDVIVTNIAFNLPGYLSSRWPPEGPSSSWKRTYVEVLTTPETDTDHDGMPDAYETANGLQVNQNDATADDDGDGVSNYDEYIAGTDPQDDQSYLKVEEILPTGSVTLRFNAVANRTYTVLYRDSLAGAQWHPLDHVPAVSSTSTALHMVEVKDLDPSPTGVRYYRLVTPGWPTE